MSTVTTLALVEIAESKLNPRRDFAKDRLDELTESIRKVGVLQPVLVRPRPKANGKAPVYELVAGHRRLRAAAAAGLQEIPVTVRELTDEQVLEAMVIENLHRADLHPLEEAEGYRKLHEDFKHPVEDLAARVGKSVAYVYARLKLCELTKEAKKAFLEDRITAGHAILLARLAPKDQERALDPDERALFEKEYTLFDEGKGPTVKAQSVRKFEEWIAKYVRFDVEKVDQMVFPETAAAVGEAEERDAKVLQITHDHYVQEEAREGKTYCGRSWKRADGKEGSKTCEHSELGVIVTGIGQGEAFRVCVKKDKCAVHWGKEIRARGKRKMPGTGDAAAKERDRWAREEAKREAELKRIEAERSRWRKAMPAIAEAVAEAVRKAPAKAKGFLAQIVLQKVYRYGLGAKKVGEHVPLGTTAEDLVRHAAFAVLYGELADDWRAVHDFPKRAKALNIDVKKLLDEHAPVEKKEPGKQAAKGKKGTKAETKEAP